LLESLLRRLAWIGVLELSPVNRLKCVAMRKAGQTLPLCERLELATCYLLESLLRRLAWIGVLP
jgi:hypothetical protein